MITGRWVKRPDVLIRRLQRAEKKLLAEVKSASGQLSRRLFRELQKRVRPAKSVSRQDSGTGQRLTLGAGLQPFRVEVANSEQQSRIKLDLRGHYAAARTKGVQGALRYLGQLDVETARSGLWVSPTARRGQRARNASGPFRFFAFSANERLRQWASRPETGLQTRRHVLLLRAAMLQALLMGPLLRKNEKAIRAAWRRAVKEWSKA